ncbi:MAG: LysM peptidoglycan-binding domain-containing protein [Desulfobacterales bacterium]|nr:MAG: LysM peptidoglycan-binding domain-containing protein [Desulfobacterales bacterium]
MNFKSKIQFGIYFFTFLTVALAMPSDLRAAEETKVIEHESGFYYTIQEGDTLWDLSQRFSDSPWQWPDLWRENSQIANPHRIYPGERIRLYRRHGADRFRVAQKDAPPELAPPLQAIHFEYAGIDRVGFIRKDPIPSHGRIFKVKDDKQMISTGDLVYIQPRKNLVLVPGTLYTAYRTLKPIKDKKTEAYIGIQHYLIGVIEITRQESGFALAKVVKAYRHLEVGDLLMPYARRLPEIRLQNSPEGLKGRIIVGEEHQKILGDTILAFIDKGRQDGVKPGQFYSIYYQDKHRLDQESAHEDWLTPIDIGELLVLHTEQSTATVLITGSEKAIRPGTEIRTPAH